MQLPIHIHIDSEKTADGTDKVTTSTVADATIGIIYFMLHEGFFGGKIALVRPVVTGKRVTVGSVLIIQGRGTEVVQGGSNATVTAMAL